MSTVSGDGDEWVSDSDHEEGWRDDEIPDLEDQDGNIVVRARTHSDPWQLFKNQNQVKAETLLNDRILVEEMKNTVKNSSIQQYSTRQDHPYMFGRTHHDRFSSTLPVEAGFDILCGVAEVEESLAGNIMKYCSTVTLYSMRMVSKQWAGLVMNWFTTRDRQIFENWSKGVPTKEEFECKDQVSAIAVDDFMVVVGMENGKISVFSRLTGACELLWVAHGGMVAALQVVQGAILSCGKEMVYDEVGKVQVWGRDTGKHIMSVRPPYKQKLENEDVLSYLLVKHGFLLAMGIEKDVWIWKVKEEPERLKDIPDFYLQFRLTGHYSTVLCCDMDEKGNIMTGSRDAQVRLWKLGPDLRDRSQAVACHNQHGNPVTAVRILWPLGMSASSGSVRLYYHPSGTCFRNIRFTNYVFDLHLDYMHFVTSHKDGCVNFWSLSACLDDTADFSKSMIHHGQIEVKPPLYDPPWGNKFVARQGKFVKELSCLVTMHEKMIVVHDFWARRGTRRESEGELSRDCDTPSSLPSLVPLTPDKFRFSDSSEEDDWV